MTKYNVMKPRNGGKTYADLMEELRWLGPASVMKLVFNGNTRQCGESAFSVAQYLIERGFTARTDAGAGTYCSHFDLAVYTSDRGWVSIDPTYIQFHAPNNESHALDLAERKLDLDDVHRLPKEQQDKLVAQFFEPTVKWSEAGMLDGLKAFEIADAPHVTKGAVPSPAEPPGAFHVGKTWREHWAWYRKMADDLTRADFDEIDVYGARGRSKSYWTLELSRRLLGKQISGSGAKANPKQTDRQAKKMYRRNPDHKIDPAAVIQATPLALEAALKKLKSSYAAVRSDWSHSEMSPVAMVDMNKDMQMVAHTMGGVLLLERVTGRGGDTPLTAKAKEALAEANQEIADRIFIMRRCYHEECDEG